MVLSMTRIGITLASSILPWPSRAWTNNHLLVNLASFVSRDHEGAIWEYSLIVHRLWSGPYPSDISLIHIFYLFLEPIVGYRHMGVDNILIPTCLWYEWLLSWDNIFHYGLFFSIMIRGRPFFFFGLFFVLKSTLYLLHRPNAFFQLWWERLFVVICFKVYSELITKAEWIFKRTTFLLFVLKSTQYLLHQAKWKNGKGDTNKSTRACDSNSKYTNVFH